MPHFEASKPLPLGAKQSYFTPGSEYHGGPGQGQGTRHFNSGQSFVGNWKDDEPEGQGHLTTKEGTSYNGQWRAGIMEGEGTYIFQAGKFPGVYGQSGYVGQWMDGKFHGKGKHMLYNGNSYDGEWKMNQKHGWGMYRVHAPTKGGLAAYEGEWVEDARTGKGISKGSDGHVEVNVYENGLRRGEGVRILDHSLFKGDAKNHYKSGWLRLMDGEEMEEIEREEAEALSAKLGIATLPSIPWPPAPEGWHEIGGTTLGPQVAVPPAK